MRRGFRLRRQRSEHESSQCLGCLSSGFRFIVDGIELRLVLLVGWGLFEDGKAENEASALGGVGFGADGAVMLLGDFGGDGETEAGAALFGGVEGEEEAFADVVGEAVTGVGDGDLDPCEVVAESGFDGEDAEKAALHGFRGVVDEVGEGAFDGFEIGHDGGEIGFECFAEGDAVEAVVKEQERGVDDGVDVRKAGLGGRELGEGGELIDEGAEGSDASEDDLTAFADDGGGFVGHAVEVAADALGGEGDGGEGILDFVGDALGYFLPGELTLGAEEFAGVFDDEDGAVTGGAAGAEKDGVELEAGAGDGEMSGAALDVGFNFNGGRAHAVAAADDAAEVLGAVWSEDGFDGEAGEGGFIGLAEEIGEGSVGEEDGSGGIEGDDAAGDGFEDGFELAAADFEGLVCGGDLFASAFGEFPAGLEVAGHVVEGAHELGHFSAGLNGDALVEFAVGDFVHGVGEGFDGPGDLLGEEEGKPHAGEEDEGGDEQQHEEVGGSDAVSGAEEGPVLDCAGADAAGGFAEPLRHGQADDDEAAGGGGGEALDVVSLVDDEDGLVNAAGDVEDVCKEGAVEGGGNGLTIGEPEEEAALRVLGGELVAEEALAVLTVDGDKAAFEGDLAGVEFGVGGGLVFVDGA